MQFDPNRDYPLGVRRPELVRPPASTRRGTSLPSKRFRSRAGKDVRKELLVAPLPELGLVAANGPNDPEPELVVENGRVLRMDGRDASEFDVVDRFIVAYGLDL